MVDPARVRQKAADMRGAVAMLRELAARPEEAFVADRLIPLARLRNLLVHQYSRIDDRRLHSMLQEELGDFDDFLREVGRYLRTEI